MPQDWFLHRPADGLPQESHGSCSIGTSQLKATNVTSEKLSSNAVTNSITVAVPALISCSSLGSSSMSSTAFTAFHTIVPVSISRISLIPQADVAIPGASSCGMWVACVANSCALMASLTATSSAPYLTGSWNSFGTLSCVSLGACTDLRFTITVSSCGAFPASTLQIDYQTSG